MSDFIIVGGGFSGLYLAYKLQKANYHVLLIEKDTSLGGRMYTEETTIDGQELFMESGAGVIRNDEEDMVALLKELDIPCSFWKGSTKIIYHHQDKNEILDYNYDKILKEICKNTSNEQTFMQVLEQSHVDVKEKIGVMIGTTYSELFHTNAKDVCEENDFNEFLLNNGHEFGKPKSWNVLVRKLEQEILQTGGKILKDTSVVEIKNHTIITNRDKEYSFDHLIVTCPYHFVKEIKLPQSLRSWSDLMDIVHHETDYLRIYSFFEEPIQIETKIATNLAVRRIIPLGPQLVMTVYTDGTDARDIYELSKDQQQLNIYIRDELEKLLEQKIPRIKKNWTFFWEKGIANWNPSPYSVQQLVQMTRDPVENIYFCGDTYSLHPGWLEGAIGSCQFILDEFIE
jgi:hypothetical protein